MKSHLIFTSFLRSEVLTEIQQILLLLSPGNSSVRKPWLQDSCLRVQTLLKVAR